LGGRSKHEMSNTFDTLARELDAESYRWLADTHPSIAEAVEQAISKGASPEAIRRFVLERVGSDRHLLATRCESAARHMATVEKA
jgi:hypothetical protein